VTRRHPRTVSLVPSVTETLLAWGVTPVAVTRFCEQPQLRAVGGTKNPDVDAIVALGPDLVVMDREENRAEDAAALDAAGIPVLVLHVRALGDVSPELDRLAVAAGVGPPVRGAADVGAAATPARLTAWVPIWRRPWMTINAATYGSSLLAAAGIANVYADASEPYPTVTLDDAAARRPDAVLAPSEPYPFSARQQQELETVAPVVFVDGKDLFWWGVRTPGALERLRAFQLARTGTRGEG
jgi:ABC-type Fe3+-hydroxamate transport system substrate-binding protein